MDSFQTTGGGTAEGAQVADQVVDQQVAPAVADQSPISDASPVAETQITSPQPSVNEDEYRAAQEKARQFDQLVTELRQLEITRQQQAQEQQRTQQQQTRLEMAFTTAQNLAPDDAMAYLRRVVDQEVSGLRVEREQVAQTVQQQYQQVIEQMSGPLYAQDLGKKHKLAPEYVERLSALPPREMDRYLPVLKAEQQAKAADAARYEAIYKELEQLKRSQMAGAVAANGAHSVGEGQAASISGGANGKPYAEGSLDHLVATLGPNWFTRR